MKRLIIGLALLPALALAQSVPNGSITQGQVWSVPQWTTAWQSKADTASPALTGTPTIGGVAIPTVASPTFTGTVTISGATTQPATGQFDGAAGAKMDNLNDRVFIGALTPYTGNLATVPPDWTGTSYLNGGIPAFGYLEQSAQLASSAIKGRLGGVFVTRASDGTGGGTQASIGVSSLALNDNLTGAGANTWNYYGTTARTATATGLSTIGFESDVENFGSLVPIYPSAMFPNGLTANLWLAAGGELANQTGAGYTFNNTSAAIAILANNAGAYANVKYDKGIVFAANALSANNMAISLAPSHQIGFFNSSNQRTASITSSATTTAAGQILDLGPFGLVVLDLSGNTQFNIQNSVVGSANYIAVSSSVASGAPKVSAQGSDANINLSLQSKGTGVVTSTAPIQLPSYTVAGLPACSASNQYSLAAVTDATAPAYNAALTGGGAVKIPVFCTGSAWTAH